MKHARQQIFDYVKSLLDDAAEKVEIQSPYDVERSRVSHIDILYTADVRNQDRETMECSARDLSMSVEITAVGPAMTSAGPDADAIALAVELALSGLKEDVNGGDVRDGVHEINGGVVDIDLDDTQIEQSINQESNTAKAYMTYSVFYRTLPGNPAVLV